MKSNAKQFYSLHILGCNLKYVVEKDAFIGMILNFQIKPL